jgi:predicted nucleotidyltransferase
VILFGSHAWGSPEDSSDLDIFIILSESKEPEYRRAREVYRCLRGINIPIDIMVKTHDEVERSRNVVTSLVHQIMDRGKILHG